ncbi:MAG: hypothetical protein KIT31_28100 [Deltaproteobacteria bacterium]|nr:hypothetical protein [Deltaproteobacteria bacterium]
MRILLSGALSVFAACGGGGGGDVTPDAPAAIDAPPHPIVGTWRTDPFQPGGPTRIDVYEASGRYLRGASEGTWRIDGKSLTMNINAGSERGRFHLSEDHATLMTFAFEPVGTIDGAVGIWHTEYQIDVPVDSTMELRADNTALWSEIRPAVTTMNEGTWSIQGTSISASFTLGTPVNIGMRLIPNVALGDTLLHRER